VEQAAFNFQPQSLTDFWLVLISGQIEVRKLSELSTEVVWPQRWSSIAVQSINRAWHIITLLIWTDLLPLNYTATAEDW